MARKNQVVTVTNDETLGTQTFEAVGHSGIAILDVKGIVDRDNPGTYELLNVNTITALFHGTKQKVSDGAAKEIDPVTKKPATPAEKFASMEVIVKHLNSGGSWSTRTAGAVKIANAKVEELTKELEALKAKYEKAGFSV